ncbi:MAG: F0F1 ATP synthase subunit delta [Candidatus Paceibacterota bacterium]
MITISNNNIAHAIYLASKSYSSVEQPLFLEKVVEFLYKRRLFSKVPDILFRLNKIINDHEGRVVVKISSAKSINETINKELAEILIKRYSAKEINLVENLDEKLLGGFKIEVNDEVIDLTIRNKIIKLQEHLTINQ